jgi:LPS sulfotransferase NodH
MSSGTEPQRGYLICSEHRSGSTLLCELLASTGKLGIPDEFLRHPGFAARFEREPALQDALVRRATSANGVFGLKLFSQQFDVSSKARWIERLPGLRFICLERYDLLGQAISLVRALQTDQYFASQPDKGEPRYDRAAIARHMARIAEGQARWRCYFARNGIEPLWLSYEQLVSDPSAAVAAVAAHVGIEDALAPDLARVEVAVQRDGLSEEWRARVVSEMRDLGYLDHRLGKARIWLRRFARDVATFRRRPPRGSPAPWPE